MLGQPAPNTFNMSIGFVNFEITDFMEGASQITLRILDITRMWEEGMILIYSKEVLRKFWKLTRKMSMYGIIRHLL